MDKKSIAVNHTAFAIADLIVTVIFKADINIVDMVISLIKML